MIYIDIFIINLTITPCINIAYEAIPASLV
jgi:hypothetical protein